MTSRRSRRTVEVESLADFDALIAVAGSLDGWRLQSLDLRDRSRELADVDPAGSLFLGCELRPDVERSLRHRGALIFPIVPDVPVDVYRAELYSPGELYDGLTTSYDDTLDARAYAWAQRGGTDLYAALAQALHDLSVDDALEEYVAERRLVGVMGGHAAERGSPDYARAARLGAALASTDLVVATGGGPGAMEAANLGAYLGPHGEEALTTALDELGSTPSYEPSVGAWASVGLAVRERWPDGADSLGVPTWFYGHEPPNVFADHVAKYFKNAVREDVLLSVCEAGVVFLPGRGGTVQEVFQNACENYYADPASVSPMVLLGRDYWTRDVPAWPLLEQLAQGRAMAPRIHLVDTVEDAVVALST